MALATKRTRLREFLDEMNLVVPWSELVSLIQPHASSGKMGRPPLTYDRGKEMAYHEQLGANPGVAVYFCDPHSPWQRGANENTNGLIHQYLPKGTDLSGYTRRSLMRSSIR